MENSMNSNGLYLLNKMSDAFNYYSSNTFFEEENHHIYINSEELSHKITNILETVHYKYNKSDTSDFDIYVKEDMHIKVFILSNCVIRICDLDIYIKSYNDVFNYITHLKHPNFEHIYEIFFTDKYVFIVSKKIIPLVIDYKINPILRIEFDDLYDQISGLIVIIKEDNYSHGDVRIDNIGYDPDLNKYVLFDFDKFSKKKSNDLNTLGSSIRIYVK